MRVISPKQQNDHVVPPFFSLRLSSLAPVLSRSLARQMKERYLLVCLLRGDANGSGGDELAPAAQ